MQSTKLKLLRQRKGLSQVEIAKKTNTLTPSKISRVESGVLRLTLLEEMELCKLFNLPDSYFQE